MLSTDEFKAFAEEYVMFAHVTTRLEGRKYDELLSEKGFGGFPSLAAMNSDGDIIAKLTGGRDVASFREMMKAGAEFEEIRAKPDKTPDDELFILKHDIEMGNADVGEVRERAAAIEGLSDEQRAEVDRMITDMEIDLEIQELLGNPRSQEEADEMALKAGAAFAEMWAAGRVPTSDESFQPFFILMLEHAEKSQDIDLFERALAKLKERYGEQEGTGPFFEMQEGRLEKLKAPPEDEEETEEG